MIRYSGRSYGLNRTPQIHPDRYYKIIESALEEVADPDIKAQELRARAQIDTNSIRAANSAIIEAYRNSRQKS